MLKYTILKYPVYLLLDKFSVFDIILFGFLIVFIVIFKYFNRETKYFQFHAY